MGCYDVVYVPCPSCGSKYPAQSKGGDCLMREFDIDDVPSTVLSDVNRHAPFECETCGTVFEVEFVPVVMRVAKGWRE